MSQHSQQEAIRAVSAAIASSDGNNLLAAIDAAQSKWQQQLTAEKNTARTMLANVLSERESLRNSLSTAADLWRILKPKALRDAEADASLLSALTATSLRDDPSTPPSPHAGATVPTATTTDADTDTHTRAVATTHANAPTPHQVPHDASAAFLVSDEQMAMVKALQNVSHTICLVEFILSAPSALERAHAALTKIQDDGLHRVIPGNAALLVDSHAVLTAVERLRDLVLLDAPHSLNVTSSPSRLFASAATTRALLEDLVVRSAFTNVIAVSQSNPCMLVAAARVVESEETEDRWWTQHLQRCANPHLAPEVRSYGAHQYKKRALHAIVESLQAVFRKKEADLGFFGDVEVEQSPHIRNDFSSPMEVRNILDWIEHRRTENDTVRRFVVPCLPPSFAVAELYEKELHRQFMRLVTRLFHLVRPDGSMLLSESDVILLTSWYSAYKKEVGDQDESIDSFLSEADRARLISALQAHCNARISEHIASALERDRKLAMPFPDESSQLSDPSPIRRSELPDVVIGCVNDHVRRMLSLNVHGLDKAIVQTVADCLATFQAEVQRCIADRGASATDEEHSLYVCRTANNMARCLEYSEDLRDLFIPIAAEENRGGIEAKMEEVIEGFRNAASMALQTLIDGMTETIRVHASKFYAPHTGTEIMLDVVATLEDDFAEYEMRLLPYHFEFLSMETLKRVVVWYLVPFLKLSEERSEEDVARRFTSLPTFEEVNVSGDLLTSSNMGSDVKSEMPSRRSETGAAFGLSRERISGGSRSSDAMSAEMLERVERGASKGLSSMNGEAVVAQIEKDLSNLTRFMKRKVVTYQKKQLQPALEPLQAVRSLYVCAGTTERLVEAFRDARAVVQRALRAPWVARCGATAAAAAAAAAAASGMPTLTTMMTMTTTTTTTTTTSATTMEAGGGGTGGLSARVAEVIWESRRDIDPVVLLEAVTTIRTSGERMESVSPSRMSSYDDGRVWGSRNSDLGGMCAERLMARESVAGDHGGSSSLLWRRRGE